MTSTPPEPQLQDSIPARRWADVADYLNETWQPDVAPHIAIIAQTRGGKSSMIRHGLLPLVPHDRVLLLDSKGGRDAAWAGWGRPVDKFPSKLQLRVHDNDEPRTHWYRLELGADRETARRAAQHALQSVFEDGHWVVVVDETRHITDAREPGLGLRAAYENLLLRGGSAGVLCVSGTQSPRWVPSSFYDQSSIAFIGRLTDEQAHKRVMEIGGMQRHLLPTVATLPRYSWIVNADGGDYRARTKPPKPPRPLDDSRP